jgi:anti-sigma B factor antagonist
MILVDDPANLLGGERLVCDVSTSPLKPDPAGLPDPDAYRVSMAGEIDLSRKAELRELLMGFRRSRACTAVVDLSAVTFMDSTAVGTLIMLHQAAMERHGQVVLVQPERIVLRVLQITGLLRLFEISDHD